MQAETRCARFKGTEPVEFIDMKVFGGTIIDQREDAVEFVKEHITLHAKLWEQKEKRNGNTQEWGTGTNRIIRECMDHGLPEPLFELVTESLVVNFRKHRVTEEMIRKLSEGEKIIIDFI